LNLGHLDFPLVIDDVSFHHHHPHRHFRLSIVDKFQVHQNVMLEEVIKVQVVRTAGTSVAFA
jgi:hypothetical protein